MQLHIIGNDTKAQNTGPISLQTSMTLFRFQLFQHSRLSGWTFPRKMPWSEDHSTFLGTWTAMVTSAAPATTSDSVHFSLLTVRHIHPNHWSIDSVDEEFSFSLTARGLRIVVPLPQKRLTCLTFSDAHGIFESRHRKVLSSLTKNDRQAILKMIDDMFINIHSFI